MITHLAVSILTFGWFLVSVGPAAGGECEYVEHVTYVNGAAVIQFQMQCNEVGAPVGFENIADPPRDSGLDALCVNEALTQNEDPFKFCEGLDPANPPAVTGGLVATAFRRIALPPSELIIEPPGGRTLVNFETNFYTEAEELTRTVTMLGQRVELRIWAAEFGWSFGDGEQLWTGEAGAPYPALEITHSYLRKGKVSPRLDTTYAAQWRTGNAPWQPVPGTVTIGGAPAQLRVVEATPTLVG